jgi:ferredoxin
MIRLEADGRPVEAREGATLLEALRGAGIRIPTLCHRDGFRPSSSCMVCVVMERTSGRLLPSCAAPAAEGMVVETDTPEVRQARRDALELLLADHVGDCAAPCQRGCPAHMDIPAMNRAIAAGDAARAAEVALRHIALPSSLGRVCTAPCERVCRRGKLDAPVAVCLLKRYAGDSLPGFQGRPPRPAPRTGKSVAVVGAGPAGLAAAYHLMELGHGVAIVDRNERPGGMLRYGVPPGRLPPEVIEREAERILGMGAQFHPGRTLGEDVALERLSRSYDAVVIAAGALSRERLSSLGLETTESGIRVDPGTFAASRPGVFAGGDAVLPLRLAVRAVAHGRGIASSVDRFLGGEGFPDDMASSVSVLGPLLPGEAAEGGRNAFAERRDPGPAGYSPGGAEEEARRCLRCDCRKKGACALQALAGAFRARQGRHRIRDRRPFIRTRERPDLILEKGKCIRCGRCIQAAAEAGDGPGLSFLGKGFDMEIGPPVGHALGDALGPLGAAAAAEACPTGAICRPGPEEEGG